MFKIAICDDEKEYRKQLRSCLLKFAEEIGETFEIIEFEDGDRLLLDYPKDLDLLFLDIAMSGIDGMTAAKKIRTFDTNVCIIFITTMYQYAIEGYSVRAFGFIKKPVSRAELKHELTCALAQIENTREREKTISIKTAEGIYRIPISEINSCEVKNHQILINTEKKIYQYRGSMADLESRLTSLGFFRCHSSFLVNGMNIVKIDQTELTMKSGSKVPVSQRRRKDFMHDLAAYLGERI